MSETSEKLYELIQVTQKNKQYNLLLDNLEALGWLKAIEPIASREGNGLFVDFKIHQNLLLNCPMQSNRFNSLFRYNLRNNRVTLNKYTAEYMTSFYQIDYAQDAIVGAKVEEFRKYGLKAKEFIPYLVFSSEEILKGYYKGSAVEYKAYSPVIFIKTLAMRLYQSQYIEILQQKNHFANERYGIVGDAKDWLPYVDEESLLANLIYMFMTTMPLSPVRSALITMKEKMEEWKTAGFLDLPVSNTKEATKLPNDWFKELYPNPFLTLK